MSLLTNFGDHTKYENDIQMYSIVFENIFFQFLIGSYTYKLTVRAFENKTFTRGFQFYHYELFINNFPAAPSYGVYISVDTIFNDL